MWCCVSVRILVHLVPELAVVRLLGTLTLLTIAGLVHEHCV